MKYFYLLLLLSISFISEAQPDSKKKPADSLQYYSSEMATVHRAIRDSLLKSERYLAALAGYKRHVVHSRDYGAFTVFMDVFGSDYRQLNSMLAQDGFPAINDVGGRVGFGVSFKEGHGMIDLFYVVAGLNNKSVKDNKEITTSFTNLLQFDLGYDLLNSNKFSIYPYGGLSLRISNISYEEKGVQNPNYTSIADMVIGGKTTSLSSTRLGYQLGVGFDFTLWQNKERTSRNMLFIKAGMNRPAWRDKFQKGELPAYNAGIKQGQWIISIGFKFASKS